MAEHAPVLTIDGPGGAGKGTVSQMLAERLGWHYLDSGVMYRVTALAARRGCVAFDNEADVAALARALPVSFEPVQGGAPRVLLDGEEVSGDIRTEQAGSDASR
ncbi:MAG: (d)CMP kinase, partial [Gammaproteobacteria bacterium]